ncbi:MAG: prolyl oligopeptidase family serine peptidase [Pseudomonadota bacterium]
MPPPLDRLPGTKVTFGKAAFARYLKAQKVEESELGGALSGALSRAHDNRTGAADARYFVIHGTSFPNYRDRPFPPSINDLRWPPNDLRMWDRGERSVGHVFINRVGDSLTARDFSIAWRATKLELKVVDLPAKGLFLHVELVQPRRSDPAGPAGNDAIAPAPGFTRAQYDRLAVIYAAASVRTGRWLVPAYHAVIDTGLPNGHDDPQNFDLDAWAAALGKLVTVMDEVFADSIPDWDTDRKGVLIARSPARWVNRLSPTTPILILHGTADWRVSPQQSQMMAAALIDNRRPVRLVLFEGSDHQLNVSIKTCIAYLIKCYAIFHHKDLNIEKKPKY